MVNELPFTEEIFSRFSNENFAIDWWDDFLCSDRQTFVEAFFVPAGKSAIASIANAPCEQQFLTFLKEIGLQFDMALGIPGHEQESAFSMKATRQVEFFEYMSVGLDPVDAGEFLMSSLTDLEAECLARETVPIGLSAHPNARLVHIDFGRLTSTVESCGIIQGWVKPLSSAENFKNFDEVFVTLLPAGDSRDGLFDRSD